MSFNSISPIDYRYLRDKKTAEKILPYLSEDARIRYQLKVECAIAKGLAKSGVCSLDAAEEIFAACSEITAEEVYKEEEKIGHDIRALVNCIRKRVSDKAKPFAHLGVTSNDIINTADAMRFKEFAGNVLIPGLMELEKALIEIARREKSTLQAGRTHGQHAEPLTFGFALSEYVSRLGGRILEIADRAGSLKGMISGAVGAYNSLSLFLNEPEKFEKEVLDELGLKPATHSTQIAEPEFILDFVHAVISAFGVLANLADDMRHLQRTEIAEVGEAFAAGQVGSSTMPHKRNPVSFENVKSMWKATMPRIATLYMDQISEHQRDLTNSASSRFVPELLASFALSADRLNKTMRKLAVDRERMRKNFEHSRHAVIAEPLYILLAFHGHPDAHEAVRKLTLKGGSLPEALKEDAELSSYIKKFTAEQKALLENPEKYTGKAAEKTESVCRYWENTLSL